MQIAVRPSGDPAAIISAVRKSVAEMDPSLPVGELRKMDDAVRQAGASQRFSTYLLGAFAAIARCWRPSELPVLSRTRLVNPLGRSVSVSHWVLRLATFFHSSCGKG